MFGWWADGGWWVVVGAVGGKWALEHTPAISWQLIIENTCGVGWWWVLCGDWWSVVVGGLWWSVVNIQSTRTSMQPRPTACPPRLVPCPICQAAVFRGVESRTPSETPARVHPQPTPHLLARHGVCQRHAVEARVAQGVEPDGQAVQLHDAHAAEEEEDEAEGGEGGEEDERHELWGKTKKMNGMKCEGGRRRG